MSDFSYRLTQVCCAIVILVILGVCIYGAAGGFESHTTDGALVVTWKEIVSPQPSLLCWYAAVNGDNVIWCEEQ